MAYIWDYNTSGLEHTEGHELSLHGRIKEGAAGEMLSISKTHKV